MNLKNLNRSTKSNIITFGIVIGFYLLIQILSAAGMVTNSFAGQLVPICAYVVMAVSLNLTVGMLGELSLGHAGFMSVGAFAGTLVWVSLYDTTFPKPAALLLAFVVGGVVAGIFGFLVGIPVLRLSGDYLAVTKAISLYLVMGIPTERAAISLSRMEVMARPARELTRLRMTASVMITSTMPMVKVEAFLIPVMPMAPLISTLPSASRFREAVSFREKCRPWESTPR